MCQVRGHNRSAPSSSGSARVGSESARAASTSAGEMVSARPSATSSITAQKMKGAPARAAPQARLSVGRSRGGEALSAIGDRQVLMSKAHWTTGNHHEYAGSVCTMPIGASI